MSIKCDNAQTLRIETTGLQARRGSISFSTSPTVLQLRLLHENNRTMPITSLNRPSLSSQVRRAQTMIARVTTATPA